MKCGFSTIIKAGLLLGLCYVMNANAKVGLGYTYQCEPPGGAGPKIFQPNFGNYMITDGSKNVAGQVFENAATWSTSDASSMVCDCREGEYYRRYYTAVTPLIQDAYTGTLTYYKIDDYLDAAIYVWIAGNLNMYHELPLQYVDNQKPDAEGCSTPSNDVDTGNKGKINLMIRKPFVGVAYFNNIKLFDLYVTRQLADIGPYPITSVYLSGSVNVPQSCIINAGDIISIDFGQILSGDFKEKGQIPTGHTAVPVSVPIKCAGMNASANLSMRFQADVSTADSDAIASDNSDIGVKIQDDNGSVITPNTGLIPFSLDDNQQANVSFHVYPVSTTGNAPKEGVFHAQAYLRVDFN